MTTNSSYDDVHFLQQHAALFFIFLKMVIQLPIAILFTVAFMFAVKRKYFCTNFCCGRGALSPPVKFLERSKDSLLVVVMFTLISSDIYIQYTAGNEQLPVLANFFFRMLLVAVISICCLPFFLSLSINSTFSLSLGIGYIIIYIITKILESIISTGFEAELYVYVLADVFVFFCVIYIIFEFSKRIHEKRVLNRPVTSSTSYEKQYVMRLLHYHRYESDCSDFLPNVNIFRVWFEKFIYKNIPGFRYSISVLVSVTLGMFITLFILTKELSMASWLQRWLHLQIEAYEDKLLRAIESLNVTLNEESTFIKTILMDQVDLFAWCIYLASMLAYILAAIFVLKMLKSYRKYVMNTRWNQRSKETEKLESLSNTRIAFLAIQFSGFQIASIITGYALNSFFLFLLLLFVSEVFYPWKFGSWIWIRMIAENAWPYFLTIGIIRGLQFLLLKFVFLHERGKILALRHRKGFYALMYFMFFYNIFTGLFFSVIRIMMSAFFLFGLFPRLDRSMMPAGLERNDLGFMSYLSIIKLESTVNNPIANFFAQLLLKQKEHDAFYTDDSSKTKRSRAIRRRWWVAYTLAKNPSLRKPLGNEHNDSHHVQSFV